MATNNDFLYVEVTKETNILRGLDRMPEIVKVIVAEKIKLGAEKIKETAESNVRSRLNKTHKDKKYSGSPKHLADSIEIELTNDGIRVNGRVFVDPSIPYAHIQDRGGQTPPHMIYPREAKVLAFMSATGDKVFALRAFHPGGAIPASRFLKDAFRQHGPNIARSIKTGIVQGIRANMRSS